MYRSLNGQWNFSENGADRFFKATVPGCNFLDLRNNKIIPDPFESTNEYDCSYVSEKDWEYVRKFDVTAEERASDEIYLHCKMLDTVCEIYINGTKIASTDNCHIGYSFPVKRYLNIGENEIRAIFYSPVNYVKAIAENTVVPPNSNGMNGIVFIRKPQCHFGWDWGPVLAPSGISDDIGLEFVKGGRIKDFSVSQEHNDGKVKIDFDCDTQEYKSGLKCTAVLIHPDGKEEKIESVKGSFIVEKPELWWTRELSGKDKQPLYTVKVSLFDGEKELDTKEKKIGLRTVVLDRSKDEYGSNFRFILNGMPIFAKGANLIPSDTFITRFDSEKLRKLLEAARFSNFNMIRIWGGGYYGSDEMYDLCDEMGILLWQDFMFACQPYPFFDREFMANIEKEIEYTVKRLSHHPSLALWCGNNEIEAMSGGWLPLRDYIKWTEIFFHNILEREVRKYDKATAFIPGSPCGTGHNKGVNSDNVGDTHLWSVWHGLSSMKEYRNRMTRFCSEFGFESLPDIKTIRTFAKENEYALDNKVMKSHQKCSSGNDKMFFYIRTRFKLPKNFEDFIYLSQVTQLKCIEDATEHWRRNKGRCNGALYWQFNDCWPVCSWSSVDYNLNYKALQYGARHFNQPLTVSFEDTAEDLKAYIINDLNEDRDLSVRLSIFDFERGIISSEEKELTVKALSNIQVFNKDMPTLRMAYDIKRTGLVLTLTEKGKETSRKIYLFDEEKNLHIPQAHITAEKEITGGKVKLTLKSDSFARLVRLECESSNPFSDNYFDILPGESKTVTAELDETVTEEAFINSIRVSSLCDVPTRSITAKERISQAMMMASPVNIGNMAFHRQKPKDIRK